METLLQVTLSNAIAAAALALVAGLASVFWRRRPALVHGLWLLVLLKLLTPPLIRVPVPALAPADLKPAATSNTGDSRPTEPPADNPVVDLKVQQPFVGPLPPTPLSIAVLETDAEPFAALPSDETKRADAIVPLTEAAQAPVALELPSWRKVFVMVWAAGSLAWFSLATIRLIRFGRLVRFARPGPSQLQDEADRIAAALGMRWSPVVELLPGRVAPMVWNGFATPRLLLPADLLGKLDSAAASTLMAHELAHLRRGDHLVRLVEFLALGLFWWHPVVWFARRALREAEEQCCDAWVVSTLSGASKTYATALVDTLDFLAAAPVAPPLACGIGHVSDLKRRLTMIMRGSTPKSLCWREGLAVLGLATLLPMLPTLARADSDESDKSSRKGRTDERRVIVLDDKNPQIDAARAELKALEAELQKKVAEVREASQRLKQAAEKMHRVEMEKAKDMAKDMAKDIKDKIHREIHLEIDGKDVKGKVEIDGNELKGGKRVIDGPVEIEVTQDGKMRIRTLDREGREGRRVRITPPTPPTPAAPAVIAPRAPMPPNPDIKSMVESAIRASGVAGRVGRESRDGDKRIDQLERRLDAVMRELEALRRDKGDDQRKDKEKDKKRSRGRSEEEDDSSL
jgi:beta-lactamase regulating signal transducer with metallopeptidase domain